MVALYRTGLAEQLAQMAAAASEQDFAQQQHLAHRIAGSAAMMQDLPLSLAARAAESAFIAQRPQDAAAHWGDALVCARHSLELLDSAGA